MTASAGPTIRIGSREIGVGHPTFVVAELSANHHQDLSRAKELVRAAAGAGADAVKIQTYTADTMTLDSDKPWFRVGEGTVWQGRGLYDLYREAATPWEWHAPLADEAAACGLEFFSTPFDATAVRFLEEAGVPAFKVASFELVDLPLIRLVAGTGRPVLMSTGMATVGEIDDAVTTARAAGAREIGLFRCNSGYPADPAGMDLATIPHMAALWDVPVGLSDHTLGTSAAAVAVALGACMVEKHLTGSRSEPGPDSTFSLEPHEFKAMVDAIREAESVVGGVRYGPTEDERKSLQFRRSVFVVEPVRAGEPFSPFNLRVIRPADGLSPGDLDRVIGRRAATDIEAGTPLSWDLVGGGAETGE